MEMFRTKWNSVGLAENPFYFILFKWIIYRFEKYQRAIVGCSSPDSVAMVEKKLGKTFSWVFHVFFKLAKKRGFLIKIE